MDWLSVKRVDRASVRKSSGKSFILSVPRKIVRLAVERNRIRRLVREAMRVMPSGLRDDGVYFFQVHRKPAALGLKEVQKTITTLIHDIQ